MNNDSLGKAILRIWRDMLSVCGCQGRAVIVLSLFVPFSASAVGSDRKPVLTFRYGWAKIRRVGRSNYPTEGFVSDDMHVRLRRSSLSDETSLSVFDLSEECVLGQCSYASPMKHSF